MLSVTLPVLPVEPFIYGLFNEIMGIDDQIKLFNLLLGKKLLLVPLSLMTIKKIKYCINVHIICGKPIVENQSHKSCCKRAKYLDFSNIILQVWDIFDCSKQWCLKFIIEMLFDGLELDVIDFIPKSI